jgi:hypothetical protein
MRTLGGEEEIDPLAGDGVVDARAAWGAVVAGVGSGDGIEGRG